MTRGDEAEEKQEKKYERDERGCRRGREDGRIVAEYYSKYSADVNILLYIEPARQSEKVSSPAKRRRTRRAVSQSFFRRFRLSSSGGSSPPRPLSVGQT